MSTKLSYDALADRLVEGGIVTDPWLDGKPRLSVDPVTIPAPLARRMVRAAESVAEVYNELCLIVSEHPHLLDDFFGMSTWQKTLFLASAPRWHGIARADVFVTADGLALTEINSDTPTGEAEAVVLNEALRDELAGLEDPNRGLRDRFTSMIEAMAQSSLLPGFPRRAGIVYPTEFTEDLALVRLYRRWLEDRGWEVVLGSPFNLSLGPDGGARLFDAPISVMVRHYKTDWWGERASAWLDAEIPDTRPLGDAIAAVLSAELAERLVVVNPFGAVLPQNKRSMAFMWEHIHRFSPASQEIIQRHVPITSRLEVMHGEQLVAEKDEWVLKSDYGAEGDEVILGRLVTEEIWRASIAAARPGRWVAQRYFEAIPEAGGEIVNYGIFLVGGENAGIYARLQRGMTDDHAVSAAAFVEPANGTSPGAG